MTKEALKLALEFIENSECGTADLEARIKEALAQPEQEPVAWVDPTTLHRLKIGLEGVHLVYETEMINSLPLYDKPQRTWVELSDEERGKVYKDWRWSEGRTSNLALCKDIEAKLKEKNT